VATASLPTLSPTVSIAIDPMAPRIMQDPVVSTANLNTLSQVASNAVEADLHSMQDPADATANLRTLSPVVSIAVEAGLRNMQDPADATANLRTLGRVVSIAVEAGLHSMLDLIAKGVASTAQNIDSLRG
jgi:hypothetical protein